MTDDTGKTYHWTRQMYGVSMPNNAKHATPQAAQKKMQSIMGHNYNFLKKNCHIAQERLRRFWGMHVRESYQDPRTVCTCIRRYPYLPPLHPVIKLLNTMKTTCRLMGY